jgi:hypothetical protein
MPPTVAGDSAFVAREFSESGKCRTLPSWSRAALRRGTDNGNETVLPQTDPRLPDAARNTLRYPHAKVCERKPAKTLTLPNNLLRFFLSFLRGVNPSEVNVTGG